MFLAGNPFFVGIRIFQYPLRKNLWFISLKSRVSSVSLYNCLSFVALSIFGLFLISPNVPVLPSIYTRLLMRCFPLSPSVSDFPHQLSWKFHRLFLIMLIIIKLYPDSFFLEKCPSVGKTPAWVLPRNYLTLKVKSPSLSVLLNRITPSCHQLFNFYRLHRYDFNNNPLVWGALQPYREWKLALQN